MSNNLNQRIPGYAESDLNKAKIVKPPRIKNKERDLYFYSTEKTIDVVENTTASLSIQAKYEKSLKVQITTPLNFDIAKPKFASISDTGIWGTQLNGFIYEDIELDTSKYNFVTFSLLQQSNIKQSEKLRIVNIDKVFDSNDKFIYASISLVSDSQKTIKSLLKFNWSLVQEFQSDVKTKFIKIELEPKSIMYSNGINIGIKLNEGDRVVNDGIKINSVNSELVLKLIKVRQSGPVEFDDLTLSDLSDRHLDKVGGLSDVSGTYLSVDNPSLLLPLRINKVTTPSAVGWTITVGGQLVRYNVVKQLTYFSKGLVINKGIISEKKMNTTDIASFLNGTYSVDGNLVENDISAQTESGLKKLSDLSVNSDGDRKYFVMTKPSDLSKYLKVEKNQLKVIPTDQYVIRKSDNSPKSRLLTKEEFGNNFLNDDPIVIEIELQREGFNPNIKLAVQNSNTVKFTQYDANHKIIGTPELQFETDYAFDDDKIISEFQL